MEIGYTQRRIQDGANSYDGSEYITTPFELSKNDMTQHVHVVGKTGVGKSTLLENIFLQDPCGIFIDPHGQSALHLLNHLPPKTDVIYFNAADREYPFAFNPLEQVAEDQHSIVTEDLMSAFRHYWFNSWGILLEEFMRYGIRAMLYMPDGTIFGIKYLLTNDCYRKRVISHIKDPVVKQYWSHDFEHNLTKKERSDRIQSTLTRLNQLIGDPVLRNILGQPKNKLHFPSLFDNKALIVNLNEGAIGDINARLLGSLLLSKVSTACRRKTSKQLFTIIVDEIHMFGGSLFSYMLSTIRKYGVSLVLAHQHIEQLSSELRSAIIEVTGTLIAFRVGLLDAELLNVPSDQVMFHVTVRSPSVKEIEIKTYGNKYKAYNNSKSFIAYSRNSYCLPKNIVEARFNKFHSNLLTKQR